MENADKEIKGLLEHLYWDEKKSFREISKEIDIPNKTLRVLFRKLHIETRSIHEGMKVHWKKRKKVKKER